MRYTTKLRKRKKKENRQSRKVIKTNNAYYNLHTVFFQTVILRNTRRKKLRKVLAT